MYEDKNHPQAVNTYICIYSGKNDFSLSLEGEEEEEQNVPECVFYCYTAHLHIHSHTNRQTHDHAYSVFFLHCFGFFNRCKLFTVIL